VRKANQPGSFVMSEKSFAVISVGAAIVCGVFFYPPPPPGRTPQLSKAAPARAAPAARGQAADKGRRGWWVQKLALLKPSAALHP
jgi:hypothetical protein